MKPTLGLKYLAAICQGTLEEYLDHTAPSELFNAAEQPAAEYVMKHILEFGVLPNPATIEVHIDVTLPVPQEPAAYYLEHMQQRYLDRGLREAIAEAAKKLKGDLKDPREAVKIVATACNELLVQEQSASLLDFRDSHDAVIAEHTTKLMGNETGIQLGWPYLDEMAGGLVAGDYISYVGRPMKGKTWQMLYSATHAWEKQGKVPMFCTFEMAGSRIRQRLAALYSHVPSMSLRLGELNNLERKRLHEKLIEAKTVKQPFWVVDAGMATTVPQIVALARMLKPDVIFLDGAYLIQHENARLDRFRRIDVCAEQVKHMLCPLAPTVSSFQFNRASVKKKETDEVSGDDVYGSDTIFQLSSLQIGLLQSDTPETLNSKLLKVMKGREGEKGEFRTNWDFNKMNFSQLVEKKEGEDAPDLEYT